MRYLRQHGLPMDHEGRRNQYDLVVTCSDVVMPRNIRDKKVVVVQEGMTDPERFWFWARKILPIIPRWTAGTAWTGASNLYDRFCVASEGYRDLFVRKGADPAKIVVTGIPNFDDCARYRQNDFPHRDYVLCCTSDARETYKLDNRKRFIRRAPGASPAGARCSSSCTPTRTGRAAPAEIERWAPGARVFTTRLGRGDGGQRQRADLPVLDPGLRGAGAAAKRCTATSTSRSCSGCCRCRAGRRRGNIAAVCRALLREAARRMRRRPPVPARGCRLEAALMRIVAVVQARMGSTRLPGKVLLPVAGATLLERMLERVRAARSLDEVVVATTAGPRTRRSSRLCRRLRVPVYAGPPHRPARSPPAGRPRPAGPTSVVKIPSDCPLIDPADHRPGGAASIARTRRRSYDYVSNLHPAS